jgi:hypothetical protein
LQAREHGGQRLGPVAFGLSLLTAMEPPGAWEARPPTGPTLSVHSATPQAIAERWSGLDALGWQGTVDGAPFVVERGVAGDHRFVHGEHPDRRGVPSAQTRAIHHLCPDAGVLRCAPIDASQPGWWRVLLDSVLFSVALLQGYEALHAAALATPDGGVVAITASMGGGKSTLLCELLGRGLTLMADDVLVLESRSEHEPPLAHQAPPLITVPAGRLPALAEPICMLRQESWIAAPTHPQPLPLRSLVVLDRRRGAQLSLKEIRDPLGPLMGSFLNFPRTPERQRARFELASVLAATITIWRLTAEISTPPEMLADVLMEGGLLAWPGSRGRMPPIQPLLKASSTAASPNPQ